MTTERSEQDGDHSGAQAGEDRTAGALGAAGAEGQGMRVRLELLWGRRERPSRGPKPRLSVERIVEAAVGIADAEGLEALSMRRVAEQLGVGTMSLYRYVPGKDALIDLMFDTVLGEVDPPDAVAGGWREKVAAVMRGDWELYHRHPWVLQVPVNRPPMGPNVLATFESSLRAVAEAGLSEGDMLAVVSVLDGYVRGVAQQSVDARKTERCTGVSDQEWWSSTGPALDQVLGDYGDYPMIVKVAEAGGFHDAEHYVHDSYFEFGLQRILDGIEAFVRSKAAGRGEAP